MQQCFQCYYCIKNETEIKDVGSSSVLGLPSAVQVVPLNTTQGNACIIPASQEESFFSVPVALVWKLLSHSVELSCPRLLWTTHTMIHGINIKQHSCKLPGRKFACTRVPLEWKDILGGPTSTGFTSKDTLGGTPSAGFTSCILSPQRYACACSIYGQALTLV